MSSTATTATMRNLAEQRGIRSAVRLRTVELALFAAFFIAAVGSQVLYSGYTSPMGAYPDEPSHYLHR